MEGQDVASTKSEKDWLEGKNCTLAKIETRAAERDLRIAQSESRLAALLKDRPEPKVVKAEHGPYDDYEVEVLPKHGPPAPKLFK